MTDKHGFDSALAEEVKLAEIELTLRGIERIVREQAAEIERLKEGLLDIGRQNGGKAREMAKRILRL